MVFAGFVVACVGFTMFGFAIIVAFLIFIFIFNFYYY